MACRCLEDVVAPANPAGPPSNAAIAHRGRNTLRPTRQPIACAAASKKRRSTVRKRNVFPRAFSAPAPFAFVRAEPARWLTRHRDHDRAIFVSIRSFDRPPCTGSCIRAVGRAPSSCSDRHCTIANTNTPRREVFPPSGPPRRLSETLGSFSWSFCREICAKNEGFVQAARDEHFRPPAIANRGRLRDCAVARPRNL